MGKSLGGQCHARGEGSRTVPSLPTRGFPALFYLLSNDSNTLSQTVTHSSTVCAQAMRLGALYRGAAGALQEPTVFIKR